MSLRQPASRQQPVSEQTWEFLFLGANIDAVETARHFGISEDRAVNYHSDSEGTQLNYEVVSEATWFELEDLLTRFFVNFLSPNLMGSLFLRSRCRDK